MDDQYFKSMKSGSKIDVVFVGHFTPLTKSTGKIYSTAGSLTQQEIINSLSTNSQVSCLHSFVMSTNPFWPKGAIWSNGYSREKLYVIGYLNIFLIRNIWFAFCLFHFLLKKKPQLVIQYNSFLFENLAMLAYRFFYRESRLSIIIQDIKTSKEFKPDIADILEKAGIRQAKKFDILVPITSQIIEDFDFDKRKSYVFQGGVTGRALADSYNRNPAELEDIAVFAGSLESYNGVDLLVNQWSSQKIKIQLHIFGQGSLEKLIETQATNEENIVYHGFCSEEEVIKTQSRAKWLISLRYSKGLNQNYFFPSKFFNLIALSGNVLVNKFNNIPDQLLPYLVVIDDNLSMVNEKFLSERQRPRLDQLSERRNVLHETCSWNSLIQEIINRAVERK